MTFFDDPLAVVATLPPLVLPLVVFASSLIEYVLPPFWGDTFILLGFFLAGQGAVGWPSIFAAAILGGIAGAAIAYALGRRYGLRAARRFTGRRRGGRSRERLNRLYRRFGERVLLVNRFLPVVRGLLLYGAGAMHLRPRPVMIYTAIGNIAWVALLMAVGLATGGTWNEIQAAFRSSSRAIGILTFAAVAIALVVVVWYQARARRAEDR